jgi:hypothetical protein
MVEFPQQVIPVSSDTAITSEPQLSKRLYGPGTPAGSGSPPLLPQTIYTVPAGKRAKITMLLAANIDEDSPPLTQTFTLSLGPDSPETRLFNNCEIDPGTPLALGLDLTMEEGEIIQALPTIGVAITINGSEF